MNNCIHNAIYDSSNDVLYIHFTSKPAKNSYGDEVVDGIVIFSDMDTDEMTGITIFYPKRDLRDRLRELHGLGLEIDLPKYIQ